MCALVAAAVAAAAAVVDAAAAESPCPAADTMRWSREEEKLVVQQNVLASTAMRSQMAVVFALAVGHRSRWDCEGRC